MNVPTEILGVADALQMMESPKKHILLFDKIAVLRLENFLYRLRKNAPPHLVDYFSNLAADLEWLQERGIVYEPDWPQEIDQVQQSSSCAKALEAMAWASNKLQEEKVKASPQLKSRFHQLELACRARLKSIIMREFEATPAVPVFANIGEEILPFSTGKEDVMRIVLDQIPEPSDGTPLEQILEFRKDPDAIRQFWGLRVWMSEVAQGKLAPTEIVEKLEWNLQEYKRYMHLHKMKTTISSIESVLTISADVAESLVKFKWGTAARLLFSFKHRKLELMEAEQSAPGREVAYIASVQKQFGNQG